MKVSAAAPLNSNTDLSGVPSSLLPTCWLRVCVVPLEHSRRRRVMEQLIKTPAMRAEKAGHIAVCSTISPATIVVMIDIFDEQCIKLEAREHTQCSRERKHHVGTIWVVDAMEWEGVPFDTNSTEFATLLCEHW